jgi:hypothetical protein
MRRVAINIAEIPADDGVDPELLAYAKQRANLYIDYANALQQGDYFTTFALMADFGTRPGLAELKAKLADQYNVTFFSK